MAFSTFTVPCNYRNFTFSLPLKNLYPCSHTFNLTVLHSHFLLLGNKYCAFLSASIDLSILGISYSGNLGDSF